jgi:hypothetical protein
MRKNNHYNVIDAIADLQAKGFFLDFSLIGNKMLCAQQQCYLKPEEFEVREMYRFGTDSSLPAETIVYALESICRPLKGILLTSKQKAV